MHKGSLTCRLSPCSSPLSSPSSPLSGSFFFSSSPTSTHTFTIINVDLWLRKRGYTTLYLPSVTTPTPLGHSSARDVARHRGEFPSGCCVSSGTLTSTFAFHLVTLLPPPSRILLFGPKLVRTHFWDRDVRQQVAEAALKEILRKRSAKMKVK
jgi:hypothetical protein